ncbi:MAG: DUF86 domain-containing protein [Methylocystis sp.]|nr:DUF86 domain-containing protein [Methylocystis sp.]
MKSRSPRVLLMQMLEEAKAALSFVEGMEKADFLLDIRTQHAVSMSLLTIGEMVGRVAQDYPGFLEQHPEIPWSIIRAMRNRVAHGYYELDFRIVWDTVLTDLPELVYRLPSIIADVSVVNDPPAP